MAYNYTIKKAAEIHKGIDGGLRETVEKKDPTIYKKKLTEKWIESRCIQGGDIELLEEDLRPYWEGIDSAVDLMKQDFTYAEGLSNLLEIYQRVIEGPNPKKGDYGFLNTYLAKVKPKDKELTKIDIINKNREALRHYMLEDLLKEKRKKNEK